MIVPLQPHHLSPSLQRDRGGPPAYELKFLVPEAQARAAEQWIASYLRLDPHCEDAPDRAYRVSSVYCDSPQLGVFHKAPGYARRKFRLRRYGDTPGVFLERKAKWGDRLLKRRTWVAPEELACLAEDGTDRDWPAFWFHRHVLARQLRPTCHVHYRRTAFAGVTDEGPVRLTVDRHLVCVPHYDWTETPPERGRQLLSDAAILELKYRASLPVLFRRMVYELAIAPSTISKYRRAVDVWELDRCRIG